MRSDGSSSTLSPGQREERPTSLILFSPRHRLMPTVVLDSPCSFLDSAGNFLLALTAMGTLGVW